MLVNVKLDFIKIKRQKTVSNAFLHVPLAKLHLLRVWIVKINSIYINLSALLIVQLKHMEKLKMELINVYPAMYRKNVIFAKIKN